MHTRSLFGALIIVLLTLCSAHASVEHKVKQMYAKHPTLVKIAKCESGFKQFDDKGQPLKNPNSSATGVMQIIASIHAPTARSMGFDIKTIEGNLRYALALYRTQGSSPWNASKHCWG